MKKRWQSVVYLLLYLLLLSFVTEFEIGQHCQKFSGNAGRIISADTAFLPERNASGRIFHGFRKPVH